MRPVERQLLKLTGACCCCGRLLLRDDVKQLAGEKLLLCGCSVEKSAPQHTGHVVMECCCEIHPPRTQLSRPSIGKTRTRWLKARVCCRETDENKRFPASITRLKPAKLDKLDTILNRS
jgi:hypothetical protein